MKSQEQTDLRAHIFNKSMELIESSVGFEYKYKNDYSIYSFDHGITVTRDASGVMIEYKGKEVLIAMPSSGYYKSILKLIHDRIDFVELGLVRQFLDL